MVEHPALFWFVNLVCASFGIKPDKLLSIQIKRILKVIMFENIVLRYLALLLFFFFVGDEAWASKVVREIVVIVWGKIL